MKIVDEKCPVPADAIEALARQLLPAIRSYFESADGQAEFAEWQAQQGNLPAEEVNENRTA